MTDEKHRSWHCSRKTCKACYQKGYQKGYKEGVEDGATGCVFDLCDDCYGDFVEKFMKQKKERDP